MVDEQLSQWVNGRRAPPPCEIAPCRLCGQAVGGHAAARSAQSAQFGDLVWQVLKIDERYRLWFEAIWR